MDFRKYINKKKKSKPNKLYCKFTLFIFSSEEENPPSYTSAPESVLPRSTLGLGFTRRNTRGLLKKKRRRCRQKP